MPASGYNLLYPSASLNLLSGNFHFGAYGATSSVAAPASGTYACLLQDWNTGLGAQYWYEQQNCFDEFRSLSSLAWSKITASAKVLMENVSCSGSDGLNPGCLYADPTVFTAVPVGAFPGAVINSVVVFQSSSAPGSDFVFAYFETGSDGNPINITPNGTDITITWDSQGITCLSGNCP